MKLIFFNNYDSIKEIKMPSDIGYVIEKKDGDEFFFYNDDIQNLKLEEVSKELKKIDIDEFPYVKLEINKDYSITGFFPIKSINYRILGYSYKTYITEREALSIKFYKNNKVKIVDKNTIFCDVLCPHFDDKGYCKYYDKNLISINNNDDLNFLICKLCYYDINNYIERGIEKKQYINMINQKINELNKR